MTAPKVFVSYSWTSKEHENWVLRLATELRQSGVDSILDKWDLKEGDEANAFMERLVADPEVSKVIIVCDKNYAEKSDNRIGGAGTEAQIISSEIFKSQEQNKFVVVSTETNSDGEPVRPAYYTSRVYIPFLEADRYSENFDQLLRWVFEQPANNRPQLGNKPRYLDQEGQTIVLSTDASCRRAIEAIREEKSSAHALVAEFFELFVDQMENFRLPDGPNFLDDSILQNFEDFLPYRNQFLSVIEALAKFSKTTDTVDNIHKFFELFLPYFYRPEGVTSWNPMQFDNFKFFGNELFLFTISLLLKRERFDLVNVLLERGYYNSNSEFSHTQLLFDFTEFSQFIKVLQYRKEKLGLNRISIHADMIKERCAGSGLSHQDVMQADFILYLRCNVTGGRWWPINLLYAANWHSDTRPFELFVRSESRTYFQRIVTLIGLENKEVFDDLIAKFASGELKAPRWDFNSVDVPALSNYKKLCLRS